MDSEGDYVCINVHNVKYINTKQQFENYLRLRDTISVDT